MTSQKYTDMVPLKDAVILTGKSESTLRRLMRSGKLKAHKIKDGKIYKTYFDRKELLSVMAKYYGDVIPQKSDMKGYQKYFQTGNERSSMTDGDRDIMSEHIQLLKDNLTRERAYIERLERENQGLRDKVERLNEEIKALLRDTRRRPRTIVGYLVERITR